MIEEHDIDAEDDAEDHAPRPDNDHDDNRES